MAHTAAPPVGQGKLHGRAFYESIGSPKFVVAPMVDASEFAWRMLTRSFLPPSERRKILAYSPMLHARLFADTENYRKSHFEPTRPHTRQSEAAPSPSSSVTVNGDTAEPPATTTPYLDGNPAIDRPLFVQFCANDPDQLLAAAQLVAPHCDAVDLNLGCPQGIARRGHYGAFLQEDQDLVFRLINTLHRHLPVPVTAKIRVLDTREATLAYARTVLAAGASILTVHGRRREQKGHLTGLADWEMIRFLRDSLPPETVLFANGNVLQHGDLERCLAATGADAVMSAEGNLSDPAIFVPPPPPLPPPLASEDSRTAEEERDYWRGKDGRGGWRVDAVLRRYLDILHRYALDAEPPARQPLFVPGAGRDAEPWLAGDEEEADDEAARRARKRQKRGGGRHPTSSPNFAAVQGHLFHLLRHFVTRHTDVRDVLARTGGADMDGFERVLAMVERRVARGLVEYERTQGASVEREWAEDAARERAKRAAKAKAMAEAAVAAGTKTKEEGGEEAAAVNGGERQQQNGEEKEEEDDENDPESSARTVRECRRPWWVTQPIVRPLPKDALAKGSIQPKKVEDLAVAG